MSVVSLESRAHELLQSIHPWLPQDQTYLTDLAKLDMDARLALSVTLAEAGEEKEALILLESILSYTGAVDTEWASAKRRASVEIAQIKMEQLKYDEAEDYLWKARNELEDGGHSGISREDISLLIAECRFGQGFVQEAVDRAEEVLRKRLSAEEEGLALVRTHQQLGWFLLHKMDVPGAMEHMKIAMKLAPALDRALVDAALEAEGTGNYEKAVEYYFDSILMES